MKALVLTAVGLLGFGLAGSVWACSPAGGNAQGGGGSCTADLGSTSINIPCTGSACQDPTVLSSCEVSRNGVVISCGCVCL